MIAVCFTEYIDKRARQWIRSIRNQKTINHSPRSQEGTQALRQPEYRYYEIWRNQVGPRGEASWPSVVKHGHAIVGGILLLNPSQPRAHRTSTDNRSNEYADSELNAPEAIQREPDRSRAQGKARKTTVETAEDESESPSYSPESPSYSPIDLTADDHENPPGQEPQGQNRANKKEHAANRETERRWEGDIPALECTHNNTAYMKHK